MAGNLTAVGTPEQVAKVEGNHTGRFLKMDIPTQGIRD